jgi:hypothetical protein
MFAGKMLTVQQSSFRRMLDIGGQAFAEVEVHTADPHEPELLAYFRNGPKGIQLVRVVVNDADSEIDWYDNNMHQAFEDVTTRLFSGPSHAANNDRNQFAEAVLKTGGVREELQRHFSGGRPAGDGGGL